MTVVSNRVQGAPPVAAGEFEMSYRELVAALRTTVLGVARPATRALAHALIEVDADGQVAVTTFSGDAAVTVCGAGQDVRAGKMLVEHAILTKVLAAAVKGARKSVLDSAVVRVAVVDGVPTLQVQGYSVPLSTDVGVEDFPERPAYGEPTHVVDRAAFVDLCRRVLVCGAKGDALPVLATVRMVLGEDRLGFTATDRYRLADGSTSAEGPSCGEVMIPLPELDKLLDRFDGDTVSVGVDTVAGRGTWITFNSGSVTSRIRALEGNYPSVSSILGGSGQATMTAGKADLLEAVVRAAAITTAAAGKETPVRIHIVAGGVSVEPGTGTEAGATAPVLQAETSGVDGEQVVGANPPFLTDAVRAINGERVRLTLVGEGRGRRMVFTDADDEASYQHVLMPVSLA